MKSADFYDKIAEVFNRVTFLPWTKCLPDLHEDFSTSFALPLKDYRMSRDKAKDLLTAIRPKLAKMISNYELSGVGGRQMRDEDNEHYGQFDLEDCVDGDDRKSFIHQHSDISLLYWWHRLDEEGYLQFTICVLDIFQRSNTDEFLLVSKSYAGSSPASGPSENLKKEMAKNVAIVGEGVKTLSYTSLV